MTPARTVINDCVLWPYKSRHTPVNGLVLGENGVHGVVTEQGEFNAERVVIAGGAWSALGSGRTC